MPNEKYRGLTPVEIENLFRSDSIPTFRRIIDNITFTPGFIGSDNTLMWISEIAKVVDENGNCLLTEEMVLSGTKIK